MQQFFVRWLPPIVFFVCSLLAFAAGLVMMGRIHWIIQCFAYFIGIAMFCRAVEYVP